MKDICIPKGALVQMVVYTPFAGNPNSAEMIISQATKILGLIRGTYLSVGRTVATGRAVSCSGVKVVKVTAWETENDRQTYMNSNGLFEWCRFVLNGWRLPLSTRLTAFSRREEFIEHVLFGTKKKLPIRDVEVPDDKVVWGGEEVTLFENQCGS